MARKKKSTKSTLIYRKPSARLEKLIQGRRNALIAGTVLVSALLLYAVAYFVTRNNVKPPFVPSTPKTQEAPTPTVTPTPTPRISGTESGLQSPGETNNSPTNQIKKLPFTAGESFSYTIQKGDSLYKLGVTFCHNKSAYYYIALDNHLNESSSIHPGDTIVISCP